MNKVFPGVDIWQHHCGREKLVFHGNGDFRSCPERKGSCRNVPSMMPWSPQPQRRWIPAYNCFLVPFFFFSCHFLWISYIDHINCSLISSFPIGMPLIFLVLLHVLGLPAWCWKAAIRNILILAGTFSLTIVCRFLVNGLHPVEVLCFY